jgi:hypothetical protein
MTEQNSLALPRTVAWLGYGGLIPFLALAPASLLDHHHGAQWSDALYAYGAIILSFIGALHWGLAMALPDLTERQRSAYFAWSVVPALIAWPAVLFSPPLAAPLLVVGFIAHYLQDRRLARQATLPGWYLPLRLRLSSVAVVSLVAGVFASCV